MNGSNGPFSHKDDTKWLKLQLRLVDGMGATIPFLSSLRLIRVAEEAGQVVQPFFRTPTEEELSPLREEGLRMCRTLLEKGPLWLASFECFPRSVLLLERGFRFFFNGEFCSYQQPKKREADGPQ